MTMAEMIRVDRDELEFTEAGVRRDGGLFSGVAYERYPDGTVWTEEHFELGFPEGPARDYAPSGRLLSEELFHDGVLQGLSRYWSEDGRLRREQLAEFGTVMWRKDYDEHGNVVDEYQLDEDSYEARRVRELRDQRER
jgi:antitoxin component YwqK of YwqJK toxin-antitoxin module